MRYFFLLAFALIFSACGTMPGKTLSRLQATPFEKISSSPAEFAQRNPPQVELVKQPVDFSLESNSPVVKFENKLTVGKSIRIKTQGKETPYLILKSWYHKISMTNVGVVFPRVFLYDQSHRVQKLVIAQVGVDLECGLLICLKSTFKISDLPPGTYDLVVISQVDQVDVPLQESRSNTMVYAAGVGLIPVSAQYQLFADYHGSFTAAFDKKLPMDPKRTDIKTFTE